MVAPVFDDYAARARAKYGSAISDGQIAEAYRTKYNEAPVRTQGPDLETFASKARQKYGDAVTDDQIQEAYSTKYGAGFGTEVSRGVARGLGGLGSLIGTGIGGLESLIGSQAGAGEALKEASQDYTKRRGMSAEAQQAAWYSPTKLSAQIAEVGTGMLPQLATGSAPLGATIGAAQEAVPFYDQMIAEGMDPTEAKLKAATYGAGSYVLNKLGLERILGRAPGRLLTGATEALTETAEEPLQAIIQGKTPGEAIDATVEGFKQVGAPAFILGAALGKTGAPGQYTGGAKGARDAFLENAGLGRAGGAAPAAAETPDYAANWRAAQAAKGPFPALPAPVGPADFTVDAAGNVGRPGEAAPPVPALPAPAPAPAFEVDAEGQARQLTEGEAEQADRVRQERAALGLGEAERIAARRVEPRPPDDGDGGGGAAAVELPPEAGITNPIDPKLPPERKLAELARLTEENKPRMASLLADLNQIGGTESNDNVKSPESILNKATRPSIRESKPWFDVEHVRDSYRFKTVLTNTAQLADIPATLNKHGFKVEKVDTQKFLNPGAWGWRMVAVDLRAPNGQLMEWYAPLKNVEQYKNDRGHVLFEKWRNRKLGELTAEEQAEYLADQAESAAGYNQAFEADLAASGETVEGMAASLASFAASAGGTGSQPSRAPSTQAGIGPQAPAAERNAQAPGLSTSTSPAGDLSTDGAAGGLLSSLTTASSIPQQNVRTSAGRVLTVKPVIVEADAVVTSDQPTYDKTLQPRKRERQASQDQVENIAKNLAPELLGLTPKASNGAPIVSADGMVESGNGRVMALRRAFEKYPERAQAYRDWLTSQGFDLTGFTNPVLVRVRQTELAPKDRQAFTVEANVAGVMGMSASEQAKADAALVDGPLLSLLQPTDLASAGNAPFTSAFIAKLSAGEQNALRGADNRITQAGVRRIRNAIMARAYGGSPTADAILDRILESTENEAKAITGAMLDASPHFAELRAAIEAGVVPAEFDIGEALASAVDRVVVAKESGRAPQEVINQGSLFGETSVEDQLVRGFYNPQGTRANSRERIAEILTFYAKQGQDARTDQQDLMGDAPPAPVAVLGQALELINSPGRPVLALRSPFAARHGMLGNLLRDTLAPILNKLGPDGPRIIIVQNAGELPLDVLEALGPDVRGVTDLGSGTVYLVADNIDNATIARKVLEHEVVGHYGLKRLMGDRWGWLLEQTGKLKESDPKVATLAKYLQNTYGFLSAEDEAAELLAHMAEAMPQHSLVKKVIAYMREALRRLGFPISLSQNDIIGLIHRAGASLQRTGNVTGLWSKKPPPGEAGMYYPHDGKNTFASPAYHGTPHQWDPEPGFPLGRFRLDKIGTGEGNAAYGWGAYFAESQGVAGTYRQESPESLIVEDQEFKTGDNEAADFVMRMARGQSMNVVDVIRATISSVDLNFEPEQAERIRQTLGAWLNGPRLRLKKNRGQLYRLDLPDDKLDGRTLEWEAPLAKQPEGVKAALRDLLKRQKFLGQKDDGPVQLTRAWAEFRQREGMVFPDTGDSIYEAFGKESVKLHGFGADHGKYASELLREHGVPGLRYFDQASRGLTGGRPKTRNLVIWDQDVLDAIKHRDAKGNILASRVFHGSPHTFDAFDSAKIGTGEGAQAYGHGIYFAESPAVAGDYAVKLSRGQTTTALNEKMELPAAAWDEISPIMQRHGVSGDISPNQNEPGMVREILDQHGARMSPAERTTLEKYALPSGNVYDVEIADGAVSQMLDWDRPLSGQPASVRKALRAVIDKRQGRGYFDRYAAAGNDWKDARDNLFDDLDEAGISALLNDVGIPGVRYLDRGSRQGGGWVVKISRDGEQLDEVMYAAEGSAKKAVNEAKRGGYTAELIEKESTRNIVLFDSSLAKIVKRGKPNILAGRRSPPTEQQQALDIPEGQAGQTIEQQAQATEAAGFDLTPPEGQARPPSQGRLFASRAKAVTATPAFKEWFGNSKVVDDKGKPLAVYHGTTQDFDTFSRQRADPGGDWGRGFYFTNTVADVNANYAGVGPDLDNKLQRHMEAAEAEEEVDPDAWLKIQNDLVKHQGAVTPVYLSLQNPLELGGKNEPSWDYEFNEDTSEETGELVDFLMAAQGILDETGNAIYYGDLADAVIDNAGDKATAILGLAKHALAYVSDENGDMNSGEILRQIVERMGFDGIIDRHVNKKFGSEKRIGKPMVGMDKNTVHYIAFEPTQIKSAIGNRGTFNPKDPNILASRVTDRPGTTGRVPMAERPERVEVGGGDYSMAQFGGLNDAQASTLLGVMNTLDEPTAAQRRGTRSWDVTEEAALNKVENELGVTLRNLVGRRPGSTANAEMLEAYGIMIAEATAQAQALARRALATQSNEDIAALHAAKERLGMMLAPAMGYRTEAGRSLNILRKQAANLRNAQQAMDLLGEGSRENLLDFARHLDQAKTPDQVTGITIGVYTPTLWDKYLEFWINGLLSGPTTHAVNIFSNVVYRGMEEASALVGAATSRDYSVRQVAARMSAMPHGVALGLANMRQAFLTEEPVLDPAQKVEQQKYRSIKGPLGKIIRIPGRFLMAEDEFFKGIGYHAELADLAMAEAIRESPADPMPAFHKIMGGIMNRPDLIKKARHQANVGTFTQPLGPLGTTITHAINKSKVGRLIVPFIRTPTNILKTAIAYTPAAALRSEVREQLAAGGKDAAMARGRMLVGSAIGMGILALAADGLISGAGPEDPRERELLMRGGWQPYSIKVGNQWLKYNRFDPLATVMGLTADMYELSGYMKRGELEKIPAMLVTALALNLGDKTFLRGVTDFAQAYTDPKRYLERWANQFAASHVPTLVAQVARAGDPYMRQSQTLMDSVRERVPGVREKLAKRIDIGGDPIQSKSRVFGSPIQVSEQRTDPLAKAMLQLGLLKGKPGRTIQGVELDNQEYEDFSAYVGKARFNVLGPIAASPQFTMLMQQNPEMARALLNKQWEAISDKARTAWLYQHPDVLVRVAGGKGKPRAIPSQYLN